ncbi:helix-turn-helix domain-containing protein [Kordia sp.]|uniref:helix-turn-helix domain-containing protein n=1 Tax=Kordia sp. TaxID=1965332 RepID=UPI003B59584E
MQKFILLVIIYSIFSLHLYAQENKIHPDSLEKYSFKDLIEKYNSHKNPNPKKAKVYLNEMLLKASVLEQRVTSLLTASRHETFYGSTEKAFAYVDSAISLLKNKRNTSKMGKAYERKGFIFYYKKKDYKTALKFYLKASKIAEKNNDTLLMITVEHKIAALYFMINNKKVALQKYLTLYGETYNKEEIPYPIKISIIKSLSNAYFKKYSLDSSVKKLLDSSRLFGQQGLKLAFAEKNKKDITYFTTLLGIASYTNKDYGDALSYLSKAKNTASEIGLKERLKSVYHYKGMVFLAQKTPDSAIYYFKKNAVHLADTSKLFTFPNTYALLSESYEQQNNLKEALKYAQLAVTYTNNTYSKRASLQHTLDTKYDLPKLKEKSRQLQDELTQASHTKKFWIVLAFVLVLILIASFVFFKRRERLNKKNFEQTLKSLSELEEKVTLPKNTVSTHVSEAQTETILNALEHFEQSTLFVNPDCTLRFLAQELATNTTYLSKIINTHKKQSYTEYLVSLRISHALKRLKNEKRFRAYSIASIALECGFKSAKSFSRAFKKKTGIYPSYYIKNIKAEMISD